jgi:hypothetical protein
LFILNWSVSKTFYFCFMFGKKYSITELQWRKSINVGFQKIPSRTPRQLQYYSCKYIVLNYKDDENILLREHTAIKFGILLKYTKTGVIHWISIMLKNKNLKRNNFYRPLDSWKKHLYFLSRIDYMWRTIYMHIYYLLYIFHTKIYNI